MPSLALYPLRFTETQPQPWKKKKIVVFFSIVRLRPRDAKDFPVGLTAVCYKGGVGTLVGLISQLSSISHDCDGGR